MTEYFAVSIDGGGIYLPAELVVCVVAQSAVCVLMLPGHVAIVGTESIIEPQTVVCGAPGPSWHSATYIQVVSNPVQSVSKVFSFELSGPHQLHILCRFSWRGEERRCMHTSNTGIRITSRISPSPIRTSPSIQCPIIAERIRIIA